MLISGVQVFTLIFPQLTIADLSIVTIVSTADMLVPVTADKWPKLYNWWNKEMKKMPYYKLVTQEGLLSMKRLIQLSTDYEINFD